MQLTFVPTPGAGRASRKVGMHADDLKAERLAAGDLVRVETEGSTEVRHPVQLALAWRTPRLIDALLA